MKYVGLDLETRDLPVYGAKIWSVTIYEPGLKPEVFADPMGLKKCPPRVKKLCEDRNVTIVTHNGGEFDAPVMAFNWDVWIRNIGDTKLWEQIIIGYQLPPVAKASRSENMDKLYRQFGVALDYVLERYGLPVPDKRQRAGFIDRPVGMPFTKSEQKYFVDDVRPLPALYKAQEKLLIRDGSYEVACLENLVAKKVCMMRVMGIGIDEKLWLEIASNNLQEYQKALRTLPREVSNWNSPAQVKAYFQSRGTPLYSYTDIESVYIKTRDPLLGKYIKIRQMYSDATSYGATWLEREDGSSTIDPDGRIRCSVEQIINTGRFSTRNPNILALPKLGLQRSAIVPAKGNVFIRGDFGGQELGIMAAASGEDFWIDAMLRGEDIHALMASIVGPTEWRNGTKRGCTFPKKCKCPVHLRMREPAKINNFLLAYGGGAGKLLQNIIESMFERPGMPTNDELASIMTDFEARVFVHKHKAAIRKLAAYLDRNAADALATGVSYSADPYRRRRVLHGDQDWHIENQGRNTPIQTAGANMLKLAMVSLPDKYPIVLPFHDELLCEVPKKLGIACMKEMKGIMEESADYITGIKGLIKVSPMMSLNFAKAA